MMKSKKFEMNEMKNSDGKNVVSIVKITLIGEMHTADMPDESNLFYYAS